MITSRQAATRVKRGVALLDSVKPNWFKSINLAKFNLGRGDVCVLGQTHGDFFDGIKDIAELSINKSIREALMKNKVRLAEDGLDILLEDLPMVEIDSVHYGFNTTEDDYDDDSERENEAFEIIGQQWVKVILDRKAALRDAARFAA